MPLYTYRREDGTTFDYRQKFLDEPLTVDPVTGQRVVRVVQPASVIFKGSGFYVNDSKSASRSTLNGNGKNAEKPAEGAAGAETAKAAATPAEKNTAGAAAY